MIDRRTVYSEGFLSVSLYYSTLKLVPGMVASYGVEEDLFGVRVVYTVRVSRVYRPQGTDS